MDSLINSELLRLSEKSEETALTKLLFYDRLFEAQAAGVMWGIW